MIFIDVTAKSPYYKGLLINYVIQLGEDGSCVMN